MDFRLARIQKLRRAEAFSRRRASVEHPTRRRADSEGRRARRLCRAEGAFSVSNIHIANESALRLDEPARLYSETAPRGSVFPPSSFRRTSNASACRFGGAACPEIVPRGGCFSVSNIHIANESALRLDEPARLYSETSPRGSVFPPSSFRRSSNASACRFGGAARPEIVPRGGCFSVSNAHIANESALRFGGSTRLFAVRWFYGLLLYLRDRMAL